MHMRKKTNVRAGLWLSPPSPPAGPVPVPYPNTSFGRR
jgi:hypothetical protein